MATIAYYDEGQESIDLIGPLWAQLNEHHRRVTTHFSSHYENVSFAERKRELLARAGRGLLLVTLARDVDAGRYVGYCVSSISLDGDAPAGEVESIFVEEAYRSSGIGDRLMRRALEWMDARGASAKRVAVGAGNEGVFPFYARYGFRARMTVLEQLEKE